MPQFYPDDLDAFFAPIGAGVNEYAERQGLLIEKYYHESSTWSLCFGHPRGGQAKVELAAISPEEIQVSAVWWTDDYRSFTRSLRWGPKVTVPRRSNDVVAALENAFSEAMDWSPDSWNQIADGYQPYWSEFTAQEFQAFSNPWPLPRSAR